MVDPQKISQTDMANKNPGEEVSDSAVKSPSFSPAPSGATASLGELTRRIWELTTIIDNIPDMVWLKDINSNFLIANKAFGEAVGMDPQYLTNHTCEICFGEEAAKKFKEDDRKVIESKKTIVFEEEITDVNQNRIHLETVKSPVLAENGKVIGTLGIARDITKRKEYEERLEAALRKVRESDELKSAFVANISHEIRTPMNPIIGFSKLLLHTELNEEQQYYLKEIISSGKSLLALTDDIMDISKIESGQLAIKKEYCVIEKLLDELNALNVETIRQLGDKVKLTLIVPKREVPNAVSTDPERLKQVLRNLLNNAIKFTDAGEIRFGYYIRDPKTLVFFVQDTGIGIREDRQEDIFKRFTKADTALTKKYEGAGLGLSISKNLVELMGGRIGVQSKEKEGSLFWFTVPFEPLVQKRAAKVDTREHEKYNGQDALILVAEDRISNYRLTEIILKRSNYRSQHAKDGREAIEICASRDDVAAVLMDIKMDVMDGLEATAEIKKQKPSLPIIAVTAFAMEDDEKKCRAAGCDGYISKPIDEIELLKLLDEKINDGTGSTRGGM